MSFKEEVIVTCPLCNQKIPLYIAHYEKKRKVYHYSTYFLEDGWNCLASKSYAWTEEEKQS